MIRRLSTNKVSVFQLLFSILFFLCLTFEESALPLRNAQGRWKYIVDILIIIIALIGAATSNKNRIHKWIIDEYGRFLLPYVCMFVYSMIINSVKKTTPIYFQVTQFLYWVIPTILSVAIFLSMKYKGIELLYKIILVNYTIVIVATLISGGINNFISLVLSSNNFGSPLEVHEIGLTIPLFLLYFYFQHIENNTKIKKDFWVGLIYTFLCGKRIALVAFVISIIAYRLIRSRKYSFEKRMLRLFAVIVLIASFIYLYAVRQGYIDLLFNWLSINSMSRLSAWSELKRYYSLSPSFIGNGIGFTMYHYDINNGIFYNNLFIRIQDVHNDILKTYICIGFIPFVLYMWYFTIGNLQHYIRKKRKSSSVIYFVIILYAVILMFTDNIMRYNLFLTVLYLIPITQIEIEKKSTFDQRRINI